VKTHWLFGQGPNREVKFKKEIDKETLCGLCIHNEVCDHDKHKRCTNFEFGDSRGHQCDNCHHKFTRFDRDHAIPCFTCKWFEPKKDK
jgi:hypothetical protein